MEITTDDTDEIIAGRVQSGDADSFGVLIERYEAKLKRYARKSTPENIAWRDVFSH